MSDPFAPEAVAQAKRARWADMQDQEFQQWRHHPITASYLQFLEDEITHYREMAADLVEGGAFSGYDHRGEANNIDVLRGRILTMRELHGIDLATIQGAYRQESPDEEADDQA